METGKCVTGKLWIASYEESMKKKSYKRFGYIVWLSARNEMPLHIIPVGRTYFKIQMKHDNIGSQYNQIYSNIHHVLLGGGRVLIMYDELFYVDACSFSAYFVMRKFDMTFKMATQHLQTILGCMPKLPTFCIEYLMMYTTKKDAK